ncbi:hypothetical protein B2J86_05080 [Acidovorax sp. SRB_14]|uniref:DUF1326 domain-containing protein n=1 Tax=unclassified Acidovorax TaxID=2684926 RepID=UPI00145EACF0|nr:MULTISPECIES: DUF1326 domain-containing protein [unclassified Acidovorax]NMM77932.1 hypothetical protein [Acidovorax sp. SRB_24]NMM80312.1 hypothetical protein [Acidovorax sp. SRB_14]NMM86844.1 hypothetical protein [Rhodococcus sp. SRB_17]
MSAWHITGHYMETCNCTFLCPCIVSNLTARPTEGDCKAALAFHIDQGAKDGLALDGLSFVLMLHAPGPMVEGHLTVGLIVDDRASDPQLEALGAIASGAAGGPMAALAPLVGTNAGIERRPIRFDAQGLHYALAAGDLVDQACDGVPSAADPAQAIGIDHTMHPVNGRLSLAKATHSRFHAFGIDWDDSSGTRNGHFAPFAWAG